MTLRKWANLVVGHASIYGGVAVRDQAVACIIAVAQRLNDDTTDRTQIVEARLANGARRTWELEIDYEGGRAYVRVLSCDDQRAVDIDHIPASPFLDPE